MTHPGLGMDDQGESDAPASFIQRSMWALAQRHRSAPLNVMNLAWRLRGPVDAAALEVALADLVARHPTLRTRLAMVGGRLRQIVQPATRMPLMLSQAAADTGVDCLQAAIEQLRVDGRKAIDLGAGAPARAHLVRVGTDDHLLGIFVHHALCDGWSSQILVEDLAAFYAARALDAAAERPRLAMQYVDWTREQLATDTAGGYADEIAYWRQELAVPPPPLVLPAVGVRRGNRDFFAEAPVHREDAATFGAIRALARSRRVTPFAVLLAALGVLLHQRTAADDLLIGISTLGRWSPAAMHFVGCATNMLPARLRPAAGLGFDALLGQVHSTLRKLMAYGRIPQEVLTREIQVPPIVPIWCQAREQTAGARVESLGLTFTPLVVPRGTLLGELDVDMLQSLHGLECEFAYRPSLFSADQVSALMADYGAVLRGAVAEPQASVAALAARLHGAKGSP